METIEGQYGKARRVWVMDRGIPTEEILQEPSGARQPADRLPRRGERSEANVHR